MLVINNLDEYIFHHNFKFTLKSAEEEVGGLSSGSKMVVPSTGFNTDDCITGSKLKKCAGSVCEDCYSDKGFAKVFEKNVRPARDRRLKALKNRGWVNAWVHILNNKKIYQTHKIMRWQDSGDLQGEWHLDNIIEVAIRTPDILHWLPTKESFVKWQKNYPPNLLIRLSASFTDGNPPNFTNTSTVTTDVEAVTCKASLPKGHPEKLDGCEDCRQCWDKSVSNVAYYKH
jgi:hypothetical protein